MFGNAAAARNGLTALPVNTGEDFYKVNSTNYLVMPSDKYILATLGITAGIANVAQWRYKRTDEANWNDMRSGCQRDQTGAFTPITPGRLCKHIPQGKQLQVELNNGNNSQVDQVGFFLADNPKEKLSFGINPNVPLPKGYEWHAFTGAQTLTAGVLTNTTLTAITFNPDDDAKYHIAGAMGNSATGIWGRLQHKSKSPDANRRPGFIIGDTAVPDVEIQTFQDFGTFVGSNYPIVQHGGVAGDTAEEYKFLIKQVA